MNRRRRQTWIAALVALALATAATVIGLLDRPGAVATEVVYPRDLPSGLQRRPRTGGMERPTASATSPVGGREEDTSTAPWPPRSLPRLAGADRGGRAALERALTAPGQGRLLVDAAALSRSPLVEALLRCRGERAQRALERIRDEFGLDLERDLDDVGVGDGVVGLTGRLGTFVPREVASWRAYGDDAQLGTNAAGDLWMARIGAGALLWADDEASLRAAVDRYEGRAPVDVGTDRGRADIDASMPVSALAERLLGQGNSPEAQALRRLVQHVHIRVNVEDHAAASLDLRTASPDDAAELAAVMRGSIGLLRQSAIDTPAALELLDRARVLEPDASGLGVDLAVPGAWILARMGCDARGNQLATP